MGSDFDELTRGGGTREFGRTDEVPGAGASLWITVASRAGVTTLPLPSKGRVLFGRSAECEVRIDDPSMSRRHATLTIGSHLEIEDLGSRNGTRVGGSPVQPGTSVRVGVGDVVSFGAAVLVLQTAPTERPRRILQHGYFEMYLEGECARAAAGGPPFAVARLRVGEASSEDIEQLLALALSPIDQFAAYAPGEYEILMLQVDEAAARQRLASLEAQFQPLGHEVRTGLAAYPAQGRTPEEIVAAAAPGAQGAAGAMSGSRAAENGAISMTTLERLQPLIHRVAAGDITVLILGETGSGKEVMADTLHRRSPRAARPLLSLNCAALSESLLESELFGYERGAFTGAVQAKPGLLETAAGGTVFLDEIGEMPLPVQAKLLRVIEQKEVLRLGALKSRPIDVRFIAATHRDLEEEVVHGRFRQDLFFRLNGISLVVPPLRERVDEIPVLAAVFIERAAKQLGLKSAPRLQPQTLERLCAYSWPGNIRELRNVMERAVLLCPNGVITPNEIPSEKMGRTLQPRGVSASTGMTPRGDATRATLPPGLLAPALPLAGASDAGLPVAARPAENDDATGVISLLSPQPAAPQGESSERRSMLEALERCAGNQTQAAKQLGMSRRTFVSRLTEYALPRPRRKP